MSLLVQFLLNKAIQTQKKGVFNRINLQVIRFLRKKILLFTDPLVHYTLDNSEILMPFSQELPFYRKSYPLYSSNVARVAQHVAKKYPSATFIDIGANIGDTVAILRNRISNPILCIEGCNDFFSVLKLNSVKFKDVFIENAFVSTTTGEVKGSLERSRGTAQFNPNQESSLLNSKRLSDILQEHPKFLNSRMIKIDTDGLDCSIIKSELELLSSLKPMLFFEYDPFWFGEHTTDGFAVFKQLSEIGYSYVMIWENTGNYLISLNLQNKISLQDIHHFYVGQEGKRYCDICAFHKEDIDLFESVRKGEIAFFSFFKQANTGQKISESTFS